MLIFYKSVKLYKMLFQLLKRRFSQQTKIKIL